MEITTTAYPDGQRSVLARGALYGTVTVFM